MKMPEDADLKGGRMRLEALSLKHLPDLAHLISDRELQNQFRYFSGDMSSHIAFAQWVKKLIKNSTNGIICAYAVIENETNLAIGTTSFLDISTEHKRLEIGSTFLGRKYWRTGINWECKYLLLGYAFEALGANRVQLKTDSRNTRSQTAIENLGATREGILRAHMVLPTGYVRDTVMFSIVKSDWPAVKENLRSRMNRFDQPNEDPA
jgi:N-acetyltransferase